MTFIRPTVQGAESPFCLSKLVANGVNGQATSHTASWMSGTSFNGQGWIQGSIYTDESRDVIGPAGLSSGVVGTTRPYWGSVVGYYNSSRAISDDALCGYGSSIQWTPYATYYLNTYPIVDASRTRFVTVRTDL